jgi:hypothetical protein
MNQSSKALSEGAYWPPCGGQQDVFLSTKMILPSLRSVTSLRNLRSLERFKTADHVTEKSGEPAGAF